MSKLLLQLPILVFLAITFTACDDDSVTENAVIITVEEPLDGAMIEDCSDVHVHVEFDASVENHGVDIVLHPEDDTSDKIIDFSEHDHDMKIIFDEKVDLCAYPSGTCFHLEVEACENDPCDKKASTEVEFCLQ